MVVALIRFEIALEGGHGIGEIAEEFSVFGELSGMGIVTGLGNVVNTGFHIGMNKGCDSLEGLAEVAGGVLDLCFVIGKMGFNAAFGNEGIHHGLLKVAGGTFNVILAKERLVGHVRGGLAAVEAATGAHAKNRGGLVGEVALRNDVADMNCGGVCIFGGSGAVVVEIASQPAGGAVFVAVGSSFPNFSRTKVAATGIGVANVLNDGKVAVVEKVAELPERGVKGEVIADGYNIVTQCEIWAQVEIVVVSKGDEGI